jgi:acyl-CoA hydrolase
MEVYIEVWAEDIPAGVRVSTNSAYYTFVAVDQSGRPIEVSPVIAESDDEKARYESALRRRQLRLVLAGRMKPQEATELRALLEMDS